MAYLKQLAYSGQYLCSKKRIKELSWAVWEHLFCTGLLRKNTVKQRAYIHEQIDKLVNQLSKQQVFEHP